MSRLAKRSGRGCPRGRGALQAAHDRYGKPWGTVFGPAIRLAEEGFTVTAKMAGTLERPRSRALMKAGAAGTSWW